MLKWTSSIKSPWKQGLFLVNAGQRCYPCSMINLEKASELSPGEKFILAASQLEHLKSDCDMPAKFFYPLEDLTLLIGEAVSELNEVFKKRGVTVDGLQRRVRGQRAELNNKDALIADLEIRLEELEGDVAAYKANQESPAVNMVPGYCTQCEGHKK